MKNKQVTRVWEFYRDNCAGFKEPMRKEMRKLDEYVATVEAENDKLREELEAVGTAGYLYGKKQLEEENAKLRELLQEAVDGIATKDICDWRFGKRLAFLRKARELGLEVDTCLAEDAYRTALPGRQ